MDKEELQTIPAKCPHSQTEPLYGSRTQLFSFTFPLCLCGETTVCSSLTTHLPPVLDNKGEIVHNNALKDRYAFVEQHEALSRYNEAFLCRVAGRESAWAKHLYQVCSHSTANSQMALWLTLLVKMCYCSRGLSGNSTLLRLYVGTNSNLYL